jgi:hypothetical protein
VDDILIIYSDTFTDVGELLSEFISLSSNLNFTLELEDDNSVFFFWGGGYNYQGAM